MPRFIIAGSVVGLGLFAIAAFIVGWFGLSSMMGALSLAALGVIVMVYVWDSYAMLYDLPLRDKSKEVVDTKEVEARAYSILGLGDSVQLNGLRYVEGEKLWLGQSHALWFGCVVVAILCIFLSAAIIVQEGKFSGVDGIFIGIAALLFMLAVRLFSGRYQVHCLDLRQGIFVCDDGSQLHFSDALIEVRCIDDSLPETGAERRYELLLCWPDASLELLLFILGYESDAKDYATRMAQLTGAQIGKVDTGS